DIPEVARLIVMRLNQEYGRVVTAIDPAVISIFKKHDWPGNVRELENVIGRAMISMELDEKVIKVTHIKGVFENHEKRSQLPEGKLSVLMDGYEREVIKAVLDKCSWNKTKASNELGISIRSLYYKLEKHGLTDNQTDR
ncbi:hypothetical protein DS67_03885, partial [Mesotoga sp. SC_4PWA21]